MDGQDHGTRRLAGTRLACGWRRDGPADCWRGLGRYSARAHQQWPQSLRTTVSLCLASNFPINIIWGDEAVQIYNDGYRVVCGAVHPRAMGESYRVTWASAWPAIGEPFERARQGQTSFLENQRMFLERNGYPEETFFTFSLSPIRDSAGKVVGLFHPVTETTATILAERRTRTLRELAERAGKATDFDQACSWIRETLGRFTFDLPFAALYLWDPADARRAKPWRYRWCAGGPLAPELLHASDAGDRGWPLSVALEKEGSKWTSPRGWGPAPPRSTRSRFAPASSAASGCPASRPPWVLVVGASPRLPAR